MDAQLHEGLGRRQGLRGWQVGDGLGKKRGQSWNGSEVEMHGEPQWHRSE
jgi:hypothetical protein